MTGRLRLVDVASETSASALRRAFYRRLLPRRPLRRGGPLVLSSLERARARRAWDRVAGLVVGEAYLCGVRELLPSVAALDDFVAPALASEHSEEVVLDIDCPGVLPPVSGTRPVDLVLKAQGQVVGRVPVFRPGAGWDAADLIERVAEHTGRTGALTPERLGACERP